MKDYEFKYKKSTLIVSAIFIFIFLIIIIDTVIGFSIVAYRYHNERDYVRTIDRIHLVRFVLSPFVNRKIEKNLPKKVKYLGSINKHNAKHYHTPSSFYGWRLGKLVAINNPPYKSYKPVIALTNEQGFSSSGDLSFFYQQEKDSNTYRVIILGGSTVEGVGAEGVGHNLPAHLKKQFEIYNNNNKKIEVINAGVGGYRSIQQLSYFINELYLFKPDLVIFYDGWNDLMMASETIKNINTLSKNITSTHILNNKKLRLSYSFIGVWSQAFKVTIQTLGVALSGTGTSEALRKIYKGSNDGGKHSDIVLENKDYLEVSRSHVMNIRNAASLASNFDIKFAHFLQPLMGIDDRQPLNNIEKELYKTKDFLDRKIYYKISRELLMQLRNDIEKKGHICIRDISSTAFSESQDRLYEDTGHLLSKGNEQVAIKIIDELIKCEII